MSKPSTFNRVPAALGRRTMARAPAAVPRPTLAWSRGPACGTIAALTSRRALTMGDKTPKRPPKVKKPKTAAPGKG